MKNKVKPLIKQNKGLLENFFYIGVLQLLILIIPLVLYPFLIKSIGKELYGIILSAQVLASYASLIIEFGSNNVAAKHISINREDKEKLSEIFSSILCIKFFLFLLCFVLYCGVVLLIPIYRKFLLLFILFYGITINNVLFPQYFFQGIEKMKHITVIITITKLLFLVLVYVFIKDKSSYLLVPILYTIVYTVGGIISLVIILHHLHIKFKVPSTKSMLFYMRDSSAIFATNLISTIKDKVNYLLVGIYVGMSDVVIYDLGLTIKNLSIKPLEVLSMVLFPRFAKNHNIKHIKVSTFVSFIFTLIIVILVNVFLPFIVKYFLHEEVDLLPLRLFSLAPLFLSVSSMLSSNVFVAWGYNKYVFYSILITTCTYLMALGLVAILGHLSNLYSLIIIAIISYFTEFIYRLIKVKHVFNKERKRE